jgi:tRNA 2-thiouridine synthesizing protein A
LIFDLYPSTLEPCVKKGGYMEADKVLDTKGMNCPMPVIKTKKALEGMNSGEVLKVEATDKGSKSDISAFANRTGNELLEAKEEGGTFVFFLKKK